MTNVAGDESDVEAFLNADQRGGTAGNGKPSLTISQAGLHLVGGEPGWSSALGVAYTVSYAFRSTAPDSMPADTAGFSRFNAAQIAQAELALQGWSDVANITFTRVGSGSSGDAAYSNSASILFANYSSGESGAAAFGNYPGDPTFDSISGDVWVNSTLSYNVSPSAGNYGALVLVHEIGHAIGLSHPGDYNAENGVSITYANNAEYYEDSNQYTVMSYFDEDDTGADFHGAYAASPLLDDIAAAQAEYGANMNTRTGATTYGFNSTADRPWFLATSASSKLIFAVWDAGGVDTFDFSGYALSQRIDLQAGNFSNVGGLVGNVAIAQNVVIENAIGGSGADVIIGNAAANQLFGGAGADDLSGGDGDDLLDGGTGGDQLSGGLGNDIYLVDNILDVVRETGAGTDQVRATVDYGLAANVEQLVLLGTAHEGAGNDLANAMVGNAEANLLKGWGGADWMDGGAGDDQLFGGADNDWLQGGDGADLLDGGDGVDVLIGGAGNDIYIVDNAAEYLSELSGQGSDQVQASVSWTLGANFEQLVLTGSALNGTGNELGNAIVGDALGNTLSGLAGADWISGGAGDDNILGGADNDWLEGGDGADVLDGGAGVDVMIGGAGDDVYVVDDIKDYISELAGQGVDQVRAAVSVVLGVNIEQLVLTGSALYGTGNALGNAIVGNSANNGVAGGDGDDWISLGAGADTGFGEAGNDWIEGGTGNDILVGGAGDDILFGGTGADRFVFAPGAGHDSVWDFERGDTLDLQAYANTGVTWAFHVQGGNTVLDFSTGESVTLMGFTQTLSPHDGYLYS